MISIVLLDNSFPYEKKEPFLETEILYYPPDMKVYIANCLLQSKTECRPYGDAIILDIQEMEAKPIRYAKKLLGMAGAVLLPETWREIGLLISQQRFSLRRLIELIRFVSDGERVLKCIRHKLEQIGIKQPLIFYSYWMYVHAYVAARLKKKYPGSAFVTRCHGYDVYEERNSLQYIPMRSYILEQADRVFCISEDGAQYLREYYSFNPERISVSRLGTTDKGVGNCPSRRQLVIVSCSWVVGVKRVKRIADTLCKVKDMPIKWIHFGDGALFDDLQAFVASMPVNISVELRGAVSNDVILD
ncbi:MAG: glycosyltransferase, partial [Rikenellaceae bacterium]